LLTFPLLTGELFPFVDLRDVPRGNSVHSASVQTPTVQWGVSEGTQMPMFDTSSLIAALNTSITTVTCAIAVGRDFLADSPANVARILVETLGQRLASELDRVVAVGNGTTEITGIFNGSGLNTASAANGNSGPPLLSDYQNLLFGIHKQYRTAAMLPMFISNDVSYQRSRAIAVSQPAVFYSGEASTLVNQLPILSPINDLLNYTSLGHPHKISQSISNVDIAFGAMARMRVYRRLGFEMRWITEGQELALRNEALLVVRGRFGGQPVDANAFCVMTNAQS
jgi:Phage capsid family